MPITPLVIRTPFVIRGLYDASTKYNVGDIVIHIVSMVSRAWLLVVDTPAGTAPAEDSMFWGQIVDAVMTATGGQGIRGLKGDEPSDARLDALIANQVLEPSDARLMTLIATLVAGLDFQTSTQVQAAIAEYLTDNEFTDTTRVEKLINEAYLNVLSDLGILQVERSFDGRDYHPTLNTYNFVRIRLNNPDAEWHIIEVGQGGGVSVSISNRYFAGTGNVTQAGSQITLSIPSVLMYAEGMVVEFKMPSYSIPSNVMLRINMLDYKRLLKFDGTEFNPNELQAGVKIRAVYDGTDFVSGYRERPRFHYVSHNLLTVSPDGNHYTITDTDIIGFGISPKSMIGFETEAVNTGNVTLSINSSGAIRVRLSNRSEIASGLLHDNQFLLLVFDDLANGWSIINIATTRSLKGQLLARCPIPVGIHPQGTVFSWAVESGVTLATASDAPPNTISNTVAVSNGVLDVPVTRGDRTSQLGWYLEIANGTTVVFDRFYAFGDYEEPPYRATFNETSDGLQLTLVYFGAFEGLPPAFLVGYQLGSTSELAVSTGNNYEVRLYISEN